MLVTDVGEDVAVAHGVNEDVGALGRYELFEDGRRLIGVGDVVRVELG